MINNNYCHREINNRSRTIKKKKKQVDLIIGYDSLNLISGPDSIRIVSNSDMSVFLSTFSHELFTNETSDINKIKKKKKIVRFFFFRFYHRVFTQRRTAEKTCRGQKAMIFLVRLKRRHADKNKIVPEDSREYSSVMTVDCDSDVTHFVCNACVLLNEIRRHENSQKSVKSLNVILNPATTVFYSEKST